MLFARLLREGAVPGKALYDGGSDAAVGLPTLRGDAAVDVAAVGGAAMRLSETSAAKPEPPSRPREASNSVACHSPFEARLPSVACPSGNVPPPRQAKTPPCLPQRTSHISNSAAPRFRVLLESRPFCRSVECITTNASSYIQRFRSSVAPSSASDRRVGTAASPPIAAGGPVVPLPAQANVDADQAKDDEATAGEATAGEVTGAAVGPMDDERHRRRHRSAITPSSSSSVTAETTPADSHTVVASAAASLQRSLGLLLRIAAAQSDTKVAHRVPRLPAVAGLSMDGINLRWVFHRRERPTSPPPEECTRPRIEQEEDEEEVKTDVVIPSSLGAPPLAIEGVPWSAAPHGEQHAAASASPDQPSPVGRRDDDRSLDRLDAADTHLASEGRQSRGGTPTTTTWCSIDRFASPAKVRDVSPKTAALDEEKEEDLIAPLTSPRSILACLTLGVNAPSLRPVDVDAVKKQLSIEGLTLDAQTLRIKFLQSQREALLTSVRAARRQYMLLIRRQDVCAYFDLAVSTGCDLGQLPRLHPVEVQIDEHYGAKRPGDDDQDETATAVSRNDHAGGPSELQQPQQHEEEVETGLRRGRGGGDGDKVHHHGHLVAHRLVPVACRDERVERALEAAREKNQVEATKMKSSVTKAISTVQRRLAQHDLVERQKFDATLRHAAKREGMLREREEEGELRRLIRGAYDTQRREAAAAKDAERNRQLRERAARAEGMERRLTTMAEQRLDQRHELRSLRSSNRLRRMELTKGAAAALQQQNFQKAEAREAVYAAQLSARRTLEEARLEERLAIADAHDERRREIQFRGALLLEARRVEAERRQAEVESRLREHLADKATLAALRQLRDVRKELDREETHQAAEQRAEVTNQTRKQQREEKERRHHAFLAGFQHRSVLVHEAEQQARIGKATFVAQRHAAFEFERFGLADAMAAKEDVAAKVIRARLRLADAAKVERENLGRMRTAKISACYESQVVEERHRTLAAFNAMNPSDSPMLRRAASHGRSRETGCD